MSPIHMEKSEAAIRVVLEFNEAFNRQDVPGMLMLITGDCKFENTNPAPDGSVYTGKAALTQFWQDSFFKSPQARITIEEIFGFGFRCVMRWRYDWVDSEGKKGHVRGVDLYQVKEGLISEKLSYVKG